MPFPTIFPNRGTFVRGRVSADAMKLFNAHRLALQERLDLLRPPPDGDVLEYLIRGEKGSRPYLKAK